MELGLQWAGFEIAWMVEIDDYCNRVLEKHWPDVPRFRDVRECSKHNLPAVDVIAGGFPCQPFSQAGKRRGKEDDRYLWPEMFRIVQELRPTWVLGENVAGLISMGLDNCLANLEDGGYETQAFVIPACAVGAPHRRDRVWILAHTPGKRLEGRIPAQASRIQTTMPAWGLERQPTPRVCRRTDGIPNRVDRLRALGNAVVPQVVEVIGRAIIAGGGQ